MSKTTVQTDASNHDVIIDGAGLDEAAVAELESELKQNPANLRNRLLLLGYYETGHSRNEHRAEQFACHFAWMIANRPTDPVLGLVRNFPYATRQFRRIKLAWLRAIKANPDNVVVLNSAAHCCNLAAPKIANQLWQRAQELEPFCEEWPRELSFSYSLRANDPTRRRDKYFARRAVEYGRLALELHKRFPKSSYLETYLEMNVRQLTELSLRFNLLDDASYFGQYLIEHGEIQGAQPKRPRSRCYKFEIHMGHSLLGRVALAKHDTALARSHLSKMPKFGDPYWRHDLVLAQMLINNGELSAASAYLADCRSTLSRRLKRLQSRQLDPYRLPALAWIQRDQRDPSMDLTMFMRMNLERKIAQLQKWQDAIDRGRKPKLPTFI